MDAAIEQAWKALAGDEVPLAAIAVDGDGGGLPSTLPVEAVAVAAVVVAAGAAAVLQRQGGGPLPAVRLDRSHVAAAVRSERHFRVDGEPAGMGFASLSRFWRTADGWVRTHANYPWHRQALLSALDTTDDAGAVAAAMAERGAIDVEEALLGGGGIAGAVRTLAEWGTHPQGRAVAAEPLISHERVGDAAPRTRSAVDGPAAGVRVLDLTRVIAGPVCTRYLGSLGADVLRLDPPHRPDLDRGAPSDSLLGKRSAVVDLRELEGRRVLEELLTQADVVVCGYRPGALDQFGLAPDRLLGDHPGLVALYLDAWGHSGPWAARRGFDSIVQAPSGIAAAESDEDERPGALPCQLLDHATGYLAAAAALDGLRRQREEGGSHIRRLSLARTAWWLTSECPGGVVTDGEPMAPRATDADHEPWMVDADSSVGRVSAVAPPARLDGRMPDWRGLASTYGDDAPRWFTPS